MELRNDCRRLPRGVGSVLSVKKGASGFGWAEEYWLSLSPKHREWVLWISWFDHDTGRIANSRVGSCPRTGVTRSSAALELVRVHWRSRRDAWDASVPRATAGEILSTEQIEALTARIWPRQALEA